MLRFVAVLALEDREALIQQVGYAASRRYLQSAADTIAAHCPSSHELRCNRKTVEFTFAAASAEGARLQLVDLHAAVAASLGRAVVIAALEVAPGADAESDFLAAENAVARREPGQAPVIIVARARPRVAEDHLLRDLAEALETGGLALHYQPKLHSRTGEIAGVEALLRWQHPTLGPLSPASFIPLVERSSLMRPLTHWVIGQTLHDQARLRNLGLTFPAHVNIPAPLVADPAFTAAALAQIGVHATDIGFEITESAMIADPEGALVNLKELADAGVHLAIDDYGTGYSSLAYLQRLPVHELKIDKRFISTLSTSARDPLLVRSTIDLAHALEMVVTAEGVECAASAALLQVMRCDLLQGFFLSPPIPIEQLVLYARAVADGAARRPAVQSLRKRLAARRDEQRSAG